MHDITWVHAFLSLWYIFCQAWPWDLRETRGISQFFSFDLRSHKTSQRGCFVGSYKIIGDFWWLKKKQRMCVRSPGNLVMGRLMGASFWPRLQSQNWSWHSQSISSTLAGNADVVCRDMSLEQFKWQIYCVSMLTCQRHVMKYLAEMLATCANVIIT